MKKPKLFRKSFLLTAAMTAATVCFAVVLAVSAVQQFMKGHWFSGCVSIIGVCLVAAVSGLLIVDLKKKKQQEGEENG